MQTTYRQLTDFLRHLGTVDVPHTEKSYLAHVIGVYHLMQALGCTEELARAGMFHSIYGTQGFQAVVLPLAKRDTLIQLIGARAERLAYLNCAMQRPTFDRALEDDVAGSYWIVDRFTHEPIELGAEDFDDLCRIHLIDYLEQVERSQQWDIRPTAFRRMAVRLGGVIQDTYDRLFGTKGIQVTC